MKTTLLASAIALSLGLAGQANAFTSGPISFDRNGTAAGGPIMVDTFDWLPGNALSIGALGEVGGTALPPAITTLYQAKLNSFVRSIGGVDTTYGTLGGEFTIQASIFEAQIGVGTGTAAFVPLGGWVKMFYDDGTGIAANNNSGLGYGDGLTILDGVIVGGTGGFLDFTRLSSGAIPLVLLDQKTDDGNNQPGVLTHTGNGSSTLEVHVAYQDSDFFKTLLTTMLIGLNDTTNLADPFVQTNPSKLVVGVAPSYTDTNGAAADGLVNGADCPKDAFGNFTQRCDFHFQSDGATSFNTSAVPEPATLALLGLGLLGLGVMRKRV